MYPIKTLPFYGIFVKEQKESVECLFPEVEYELFFIEGGGVLGGGLLKSLRNYIGSIFTVNKRIRDYNYDLVHIHYGLSGLFMLNPFRKKVPTVLTLHGGDILEEQQGSFQVYLTKQIIKKVSHTIALNDRMYSIVKKYNQNVSIIPCAVDTDLFTPSNSKKKNINPLIVFPSSRHRPVKDFPLFEDAIKILQDKYKINCFVSEVDNMTREEVCSLFQRADLLLMTSLSEGSPQVVKEAMSCNLPVVSTPVGDVNVLLSGVQNSAVATSHDKEELAKLCADSLNNTIDGIPGRVKIEKLGLDKKSIAMRVFNVYKECCYK